MNLAPVLEAAIANQTGTVGSAFTLSIAPNFSDPEGGALIYTASGLPPGKLTHTRCHNSWS